jgi:hypothetical protein
MFAEIEVGVYVDIEGQLDKCFTYLWAEKFNPIFYVCSKSRDN